MVSGQTKRFSAGNPMLRTEPTVRHRVKTRIMGKRCRISGSPGQELFFLFAKFLDRPLATP